MQFIIDDGNFLLPDEAVLEVLLFTMEHGPPLGIHLHAGKTELLMGKHGSYDDDDAYLFFEELTNPEGLYHLQPERVRFHPDDYPSDALLYGTRVLGTLSWRFSIIIGAETCLLHEREPEALRR